ncbi:MAG: hypothetical protein FWD09_05460 [Lentimicrobiaceae bacterium]|nr:hypothetical protein [Lentimicrobiaceae bacterium]
MNINPQNNALTFESVWAALMETDRQMKETDRKREEGDRRFKEEREKRERQFQKERKESERQRKESDRQYKKEREESDRRFKEEREEGNRLFNERMKLLDEKMAKTNEQIGGISRSNGEFCEEYFVNAFEKNPTFLGEKFDHVQASLKPYPVVVLNDQYDLVLSNGKTVVIIEMKYKAGTNDVGRMFRKLESYRANYPMHKDYKIYLGLASFSFSDDVRKRADEMGVILIQQQGEKIEIISETIKAW